MRNGDRLDQSRRWPRGHRAIICRRHYEFDAAAPAPEMDRRSDTYHLIRLRPTAFQSTCGDPPSEQRGIQMAAVDVEGDLLFDKYDAP